MSLKEIQNKGDLLLFFSFLIQITPLNDNEKLWLSAYLIFHWLLRIIFSKRLRVAQEDTACML
jgi:hypothetical protein